MFPRPATVNNKDWNSLQTMLTIMGLEDKVVKISKRHNFFTRINDKYQNPSFVSIVEVGWSLNNLYCLFVTGWLWRHLLHNCAWKDVHCILHTRWTVNFFLCHPRGCSNCGSQTKASTMPPAWWNIGLLFLMIPFWQCRPLRRHSLKRGRYNWLTVCSVKLKSFFKRRFHVG